MLTECVCRDRSRSRGEAAQSVTIHQEKKGRKGAGVTLIRGLPLNDTELAKLAKTLKTKCGVGGAVKNGVIELQGDQRSKVQAMLQDQGYSAKLSGGSIG